jgi:predicted esterase
MKNNIISAGIICLSFSFVKAQDSCFGGRYQSMIFSSTTSQDVQYGQNVDINNQTINLMMRIIQPVGDTLSCRPLVILMHGGGWVAGNYTDPATIGHCTRLARRGYVAASAGYRLGVQGSNYAEAIYRGMQDLKAAVRWFRANANLYDIDTSQIFIGGFSAGAINSIHAAYWDLSEVPSSIIATWGNFEASGNPGYSDSVHGVVSCSGSIQNLSWLSSEITPFVAIHDIQDAVVPYNNGTGSYAIHTYLIGQGTSSHLYSLNGANPPNNHMPPSNTLYEQAIIDSLYFELNHHNYAVITQNLNTLTANAGGGYQWYTNGTPINGATGQNYSPPASGWYYVEITNCGCYSTSDSVWFSLTGLPDIHSANRLIIYPNPSDGNFIVTGLQLGKGEIEICNVIGKIVYKSNDQQFNKSNIDLSSQEAGFYIIKIYSSKEIYTGKIVIKK